VETERVAFERHLDTCPACAEEARGARRDHGPTGRGRRRRPPPGLWDRVRGEALAGGLRPAPAGRTYQLWVVGRSGPRPAGLVEVAGGGRVARLLDGPVTGTEQLAVTVERRGGAARPTSEPVVVVDLRA
jgi:anti-sigma factor RsiW